MDSTLSDPSTEVDTVASSSMRSRHTDSLSTERTRNRTMVLLLVPTVEAMVEDMAGAGMDRMEEAAISSSPRDKALAQLVARH